MSLGGGLARSFALLDPARRPAAAPIEEGYLDLLGGEELEPTGVAQRFMHTGVVPEESSE